MPYLGGPNDAFQSGVNHVVNSRGANENSIVLDGALQRDSDHWNSLTPHGVLNVAMGASSQNDGSWERLQRDAGGYAPGSMEATQDQLDQGSNDNLP